MQFYSRDFTVNLMVGHVPTEIAGHGPKQKKNVNVVFREQTTLFIFCAKESAPLAIHKTKPTVEYVVVEVSQSRI